jgi:hypothetical protein
MAPPLASGAAQITDLLSLSCASGTSVATTAGSLTVDCPTTQMQGLVVTSDATFDTKVTVASQLVVGEIPPSGPAGASVDETTTGEIILNGENLAGKLMTRLSHTFSGEDFLAVDQPDCPTGFVPDIVVMPIAFKSTQDLRAVETEFTTSGSLWKVKLLVKSELPGISSVTTTETNPSGSKVAVLTGCSP